MKTPDCVIWGLTKRHNSKLVKFNGNQWTHNPLSITGFHNASSSSSSINVGSAQKKTKKSFRSVITLNLKHKLGHGAKSAKSAHSQSKIAHSQLVLSKDVGRVAKAIQGLTFQNQKEKNQALRKLARQNAANSRHVAKWGSPLSDRSVIWKSEWGWSYCLSRISAIWRVVLCLFSPARYRGLNCNRRWEWQLRTRLENRIAVHSRACSCLQHQDRV